MLNLSWDTSYVFDTYRSIGLGEDTRATARAAIVDALKEVPKPFAWSLDEGGRGRATPGRRRIDRRTSLRRT